MSLYNSILQKIVLPVGDLLFGNSYLKHLKKWRDYDKKSEEALQQIQHDKLAAILKLAVEKVPYYKSLSLEVKENPYDTLSAFPVLTKALLRSEVNALISEDYAIETLDKNHSSGSSGLQSFTYMTKAHKFYLRALQTHWWRWSSYSIGSPLLQFGISHQRTLVKKLKDIFYRCFYVKAFGLSEEELSAVSKKVTASKIAYIAGYPSVINQLALSTKQNNLSPQIKGIVCFGDKLFDHHKENIKSAFGEHLKLVDTYGCAEGLLMACQYDTPYYYIMSPHVHIEVVDDNNKPVADGVMGNVLITCLTNEAMPLIRYKLGDLAIKLPRSEYPDNRLLQYPLLQKIVGRETDVIKSRNGVVLNVHSFTGVMEYYEGIKQYKVIQETLDEITIQYIVDDSYKFETSVLTEISKKLNALTKSDLIINFEAVSFIAPSGSGKPQIIESKIKAP